MRVLEKVFVVHPGDAWGIIATIMGYRPLRDLFGVHVIEVQAIGLFGAVYALGHHQHKISSLMCLDVLWRVCGASLGHVPYFLCRPMALSASQLLSGVRDRSSKEIVTTMPSHALANNTLLH